MKTAEKGQVSGALRKIVADAACTFCGCVCDDIELVVEGDRIVEARNACWARRGFWAILGHIVQCV